ncbi:MAG: PIN domain-containing protein [Burkholderiales bacterium]|jgi:predicted nucleic acid-binding protein|nr:PIN domain-containing protein [Burkholderiales bacterium]
MTAPVFVDTNVIVYARDAREPAKQRLAESWLDHLWRERLGRTSFQVLSEYYVSVTRKLDPGLPPEEAWDDVNAMMAWNPRPIDRAALERGRAIEARYRLSWWDSLVVAAAQLEGCAVLLTEDLQDGAQFDGVTVRSPFTLSVAEPRAAYTIPSATSRHPRRGRPRRAA